MDGIAEGLPQDFSRYKNTSLSDYEIYFKSVSNIKYLIKNNVTDTNKELINIKKYKKNIQNNIRRITFQVLKLFDLDKMP